ncbi:hypothetical protein ACIO8F_40500 [Streptomyces sp. NPDC087228]|uniref:hypothetical protein n=1 Tax=unclassified Streptomyces TaxID=2593676 RepID=UPI00382AF1DC
MGTGALWSVLLVLRRAIAGDPEATKVREVLQLLCETLVDRPAELVVGDLERVVAVLTPTSQPCARCPRPWSSTRLTTALSTRRTTRSRRPGQQPAFGTEHSQSLTPQHGRHELAAGLRDRSCSV